MDTSHRPGRSCRCIRHFHQRGHPAPFLSPPARTSRSPAQPRSEAYVTHPAMGRDARALGVGTAEGYPFRDRIQFLASVGCGRRAVREDRDDTAHGRHLREVPLVEALDEATVAPFAFGQSLRGPPPVRDLFEPRENMCHFMAAPDRQAPDMEYPRPPIARDDFLP